MARTAHSDIGASSAERWWNCPGSRALARTVGPQTTSVFAAEGTAAHKLREVCLEDGSDAEDHIGRVIVVPPAWDGDRKFEFTVDEAMAEAVQVHIDRIRAILAKYPDAEVSHELGLDLSHLHPDAFGTADTVIYIPSEKWLIVDDYKHGSGVIKKAKGNPQGRYYATGAMRLFHNRGLRKVTIGIVQPRGRAGQPIDEDTFPAIDLVEWRADLKDAMHRTDDPNAPRVAGDHCRFCPAAAICPEFRAETQRRAMADFSNAKPVAPKLEEMSLDQLGTLLAQADFLQSWVSAVKEYAHNRALQGDIATGHKLVVKKSNRRWRDEEETVAVLTGCKAVDVDGEKLIFPKAAALSRAQLFVEKLRSPAQIEKLLGKKSERALAALTIRADNGYALVAISDSRPDKQTTAAEDFTRVG